MIWPNLEKEGLSGMDYEILKRILKDKYVSI